MGARTAAGRRAVDELPGGRRAFRPEVQALRAVAVAAVVLYHLWPHEVPGGFVGVDVFFVISGFLITQQLAEESLRTGRVSLTRFWARRVRRILPAALTVLAACVGIALWLMPQELWQSNLDEIRAAALYGENWLLGTHAVDYLAAENTPSLVQHYWSLSVEEQFYLVWPLLVLGAAAAARRARVKAVAALTLSLGAAFLISLVVSALWTRADPAMAFFATPTRAWEFAAGGLVALAVRRDHKVVASVRTMSSWVGLGIVFASAFAITKHNAFPGLVALVPVVGAALFIAAGLPSGRWSTGRVVTPGPVQWLGNASYSVYLWHWPLIIAAPWVTHGPVSTIGKLAVLILTLVLAAATTRLVEEPIRRGVRWRDLRWPAYTLAVVGVAALVAVTSVVGVDVQRERRTVTAAARAASESQTRALLATHHRSCFGAAAMVAVNQCAHPYARPPHLDTAFAAADGRTDPCLENYDASIPLYCTRGRVNNPSRTIALVGNSHAWRLIPALSLYGERHGWRVVTATRINCLGLITRAVTSTGASANCLRWSAAVQQHLLAMPHLDAVVFAGYRYADAFLAGMSATSAQIAGVDQQVVATWNRFVAHGVQVVVTGDVPGMRPTIDPECLAQSADHSDPCSRARGPLDHLGRTEMIARSHPHLATYVPLIQFFCDQKKCHALIGGVVVYFDSHHLTATYSRSMARYLGAALAAVIKRPTEAPRA